MPLFTNGYHFDRLEFEAVAVLQSFRELGGGPFYGLGDFRTLLVLLDIKERVQSYFDSPHIGWNLGVRSHPDPERLPLLSCEVSFHFSAGDFSDAHVLLIVIEQFQAAPSLRPSLGVIDSHAVVLECPVDFGESVVGVFVELEQDFYL